MANGILSGLKRVSEGEYLDSVENVISEAKYHEYPGLLVRVLSPRYYYNKEENDSYSLQILAAKKRVDFSDVFWEEMLATYERYKSKINANLITTVPTGKPYMPITPTINSICQKLSQHTKIPYEQVIMKILFRRTEGRSKKELYDAVKDTMKVIKPITGRVLLLDDVRSSGMHMLECAKILKEAGASGVVGLCLGTHGNKKWVVQ